MYIDEGKSIIVWLDELRKIVFTKEMPDTKAMVFESAEDLSKFVSRGYKIG